jgi:WD40 repeat protein
VLGYDYLALVGTPALQRSIDDVQRLEQYGEGSLYGVRWAGDSSTALVFGDMNSPVQLVPTAEGGSTISLEGHTKAVKEATFIDDQIITYSDDGTARMWTAQGEPMRVFGLPTASAHMRGGVFSDDGTRLLTFLNNGEASIWNVDSGELITRLSGHAGSILHAAWHDAYVVTTAVDNTARIWNADNGRALTTLRGHTQRVLGSRWIDPQRLLTYGADGSLRVWQVFDAQGVLLCEGMRSDGVPLCRAQSKTFAVGGEIGSSRAARWRDDSTVSIRQSDGSLRDWTLPSGSESDVLAITDHLQEVWEPQGSRLLAYSRDGDGEIINLDTGDSVNIDGPVEAAFWLDTGLLISEGMEGARWFASPVSVSEPMRLDHLGTLRITDADIYASEGLLATALAEGPLIVTNVRTGEQVKELALNATASDMPGGTSVLNVTWTGNGTHLLTIDTQGWVRLWEYDAGEPVWSWSATGTETRVTAADVAFSPDGERVAIMAALNAVAPERVYILETRTGTVIWPIDTRHDVLGVEWSPTGNRVLTWGQTDREAGASDNGIAQVWDVAAQAEVLRLTDTDIIFSAAFNGSGTSILTRNQAGVARVWPAWPNRDSLPSLIAFAEACCTPQDDGLEE